LSEGRHIRLFLVLVFLAVVSGVGLVQAAYEMGEGNRPQWLDLFVRPPTQANLRIFEKDLEEGSCFVRSLRPWMQSMRFSLLHDPGKKGLVGSDGWFFYRLGVRYLTERWEGGRSDEANRGDAVAAIVSFRDRLAERGIRLLVVPVPGKASVYPEMLASRAAGGSGPVNVRTVEVVEKLRESGVEVVDLCAVLLKEKSQQSEGGETRYYLSQDTHWSPEGVDLAARTVASRLVELGWTAKGTVAYDLKPAPVERHGDVIEMMKAPRVAKAVPKESFPCTQVVTSETGDLYRDDPESDVLVLGDSFLRVYEIDEPTSAGFVSHLARELGKPLASVVNDGGASTLVRQELYRKPSLLSGKKVVIWEFVERDIRFGTEGWQAVPLPEIGG
jgi:acetyltransferase AlgX (SGNH hydrolase-like protein)